MIAGAQTIVVLGRTRWVTAICEACLDQQPELRDGYFGARVEASLPLEHDHGSAMCPRGHEIRVVRARHAEGPYGSAAA